MTSCAALNPPEIKVSDSFCSVYQQVVRAKGEGDVQAPKEAKQRILANELTYRCLCKGEQNFC